MRTITRAVLGIAVTLLPAAAPVRAQVESAKPYAPVGLFLGAVEEGARIFTPVRLLPPAHPEGLGHDFPTVLQLHDGELPLLLWLGKQVGLRLSPTLQRYPTEPSAAWPYADVRVPPDTAALRRARVSHRARADAPLPGLRVALYDGPKLVAFIVDTRGLTLAERGMSRPTSMGLDVPRAEFLRRVATTAPAAGGTGLVAVLWDR